MSVRAYYNENDPYCAKWLRNLIAAGHIAAGDVDERSIIDVHPHELAGYTQCHFFAGIGGWSYALRLAGWPDDRPVWTGSCPCQPFSAAGKGRGITDERHLWPYWFHLISECGPGVVFGEQVASSDGLAWFDIVSTDMEAARYAIGAADICAASVGAPHVRQRLYFVADTNTKRRRRKHALLRWWQQVKDQAQVAGSGKTGELADCGSKGRKGNSVSRIFEQQSSKDSESCAMADANSVSRRQRSSNSRGSDSGSDAQQGSGFGGNSGALTFWSNAEWIDCLDSRKRPIEPGSFPLVDGVPGRVGRLRAYGNAIVPQQAQVFIQSYIDSME